MGFLGIIDWPGTPFDGKHIYARDRFPGTHSLTGDAITADIEISKAIPTRAADFL